MSPTPRIAVGFCLALTVLLPGCGIADHFKSQDRMEKSQDAYRTCVSQNLATPERCNALKAIYEADRAAFEGR